jgi:hypothetical protein
MSGDSRQSLHFVTFFTDFSQIHHWFAAQQTDGLAEASSSS